MKKEISNKKILVKDAQQNKEIQTKLITMGFEWLTKGNVVHETIPCDFPFYIFTDDGEYLAYSDENFGKTNSREELILFNGKFEILNRKQICEKEIESLLKRINKTCFGDLRVREVELMFDIREFLNTLKEN